MKKIVRSNYFKITVLAVMLLGAISLGFILKEEGTGKENPESDMVVTLPDDPIKRAVIPSLPAPDDAEKAVQVYGNWKN